jgi:phage-related protein
MLPHLVLTDKDGNVYNFPDSFFLTSDPVSTRSSIKELLYAHGGRQVGDGFVQSRKLQIEGFMHNDTQVGFETAYRSLMRALTKGGKLTISNDIVSRYIDVGNPSVDSSWEYYPLFKNVNITFDAPFPFWQDSTDTTETHVVAGNTTFTLDASGSDTLMMPVIEIDSDQGVNVTNIIMRNITDSGNLIEYTNPNFLAGNILVIDSIEGTIRLNNVDAMTYFISGTLLRLLPVINTIEYEGAACTIKITYRKLYL